MSFALKDTFPQVVPSLVTRLHHRLVEDVQLDLLLQDKQGQLAMVSLTIVYTKIVYQTVVGPRAAHVAGDLIVYCFTKALACC